MKNIWHILVVEDDPTLGPATCEVLVLIGHRCTLAECVSAAFAHLSQAHDVEIVLLDLQVGPERGETLIERLRMAGHSVPHVFIFSAQPDSEIQRAMSLTQAKGFVRKPSTGRQIHRTLEMALA